MRDRSGELTELRETLQPFEQLRRFDLMFLGARELGGEDFAERSRLPGILLLAGRRVAVRLPRARAFAVRSREAHELGRALRRRLAELSDRVEVRFAIDGGAVLDLVEQLFDVLEHAEELER